MRRYCGKHSRFIFRLYVLGHCFFEKAVFRVIQLSYGSAPFIADENNIPVFILAIHGCCDYMSLDAPCEMFAAFTVSV